MLILINDNNLFVNEVERNILYHLAILVSLETILVRDYSIPAMIVSLPCRYNLAYANLKGLQTFASQLPTYTNVALHSEIQKFLPILTVNANKQNPLYLGMMHNRIAMSTVNLWEGYNDTGNVQGSTI